MKITCIYTREDNGGYTVEALELPGCISYGQTLEEAESMIRDAAIWYIASLKKHGDILPNETKQSFISSLQLYEAV